MKLSQPQFPTAGATYTSIDSCQKGVITFQAAVFRNASPHAARRELGASRESPAGAHLAASQLAERDGGGGDLLRLRVRGPAPPPSPLSPAPTPAPSLPAAAGAASAEVLFSPGSSAPRAPPAAAPQAGAARALALRPAVFTSFAPHLGAPSRRAALPATLLVPRWHPERQGAASWRLRLRLWGAAAPTAPPPPIRVWTWPHLPRSSETTAANMCLCQEISLYAEDDRMKRW
ncbi:translation initiation factor IF-2-like [Oryx dammah]|uniref:translation initiation factor IF-2-like n=1 Tax=Oryx dammah TaxID=59534 RepID=UPI001A9AF289|nr:translation initiation factor IF-2-like [Oryx dammah]